MISSKSLKYTVRILLGTLIGVYLGIIVLLNIPYVQGKLSVFVTKELKNILNEQINPEEPDAFWCSDITYIWTFEGFTYLTSIMDLFSRKSGSHKGNEEKLLEESISMG